MKPSDRSARFQNVPPGRSHRRSGVAGALADGSLPANRGSWQAGQLDGGALSWDFDFKILAGEIFDKNAEIRVHCAIDVEQVEISRPSNIEKLPLSPHSPPEPEGLY